MRRVVSVILLVIGGYLLAGEALIAWIDVGEGWGAQLFLIGFSAALAMPFMTLGTWVSPGNRLADLGMTLMVTAGVAAFCALAIWIAFNDPQVVKMLPPGQTLPAIAINPVSGGLNLLLIAGGGYMLWRRGRGREKARRADLERVFGD